MADIEIVFKTRAELAGAQQVAASLEKQIGAAKALGENYSHLEAKLSGVQSRITAFTSTQGGAGGGMFSQLNSELVKVVPGLGRFEGGLAKLTSGPLGLLSAGLATAAGAFKFASSAITEYAEAQDAVTKLDAGLARSGLLTDQYREQLQKLAGTLSEATAIADEKWLVVLAKLTQFGANPDNIEKYAKAVENLAGIMGGDIESAATIMSRALQGSFQMFGRYGIILTETNDKTKKLEELMRKLAELGEGQLAASTRTLSGQYRSLKLSLGEFTEGVGGAIARTGILQEILDRARITTKFFADMVGSVIPKTDGLSNSVSKAAAAMEDGADSTTKAKSAMDEYEKKIKATTDRLKELADEEDKRLAHEDRMDKARKDVELAALKLAEKGGLPADQAAAEKFRIEERYEFAAFNRRQESARKTEQANIVAMANLAKEQEIEDQREAKARQYGPQKDTIEYQSSISLRHIERMQNEMDSLKKKIAEADNKDGLSPREYQAREGQKARLASLESGFGPEMRRYTSLTAELGNVPAFQPADVNYGARTTARRDAMESLIQSTAAQRTTRGYAAQEFGASLQAGRAGAAAERGGPGQGFFQPGASMDPAAAAVIRQLNNDLQVKSNTMYSLVQMMMMFDQYLKAMDANMKSQVGRLESQIKTNIRQ